MLNQDNIHVISETIDITKVFRFITNSSVKIRVKNTQQKFRPDFHTKFRAYNDPFRVLFMLKTSIQTQIYILK